MPTSNTMRLTRAFGLSWRLIVAGIALAACQATAATPGEMEDAVALSQWPGVADSLCSEPWGMGLRAGRVPVGHWLYFKQGHLEAVVDYGAGCDLAARWTLFPRQGEAVSGCTTILRIDWFVMFFMDGTWTSTDNQGTVKVKFHHWSDVEGDPERGNRMRGDLLRLLHDMPREAFDRILWPKSFTVSE